MRQFILGALAGIALLLVIGYAAGYMSKKTPTVSVLRQDSTGREIIADVMDEVAAGERTNDSSRTVVAAPAPVVNQVAMSAEEKEAMKQEIMNSIKAQMDICRPAPVCEEKKAAVIPVPVRKKIVRRKTPITKNLTPAPLMAATPVCSEGAAYRACLNDRYAKWDDKCTTKTVETVEAKPWKNEHNKLTRMESQATIIEIDAENICASPRTEIERYCLQKICLEVK